MDCSRLQLLLYLISKSSPTMLSSRYFSLSQVMVTPETTDLVLGTRASEQASNQKSSCACNILWNWRKILCLAWMVSFKWWRKANTGMHGVSIPVAPASCSAILYQQMMANEEGNTLLYNTYTGAYSYPLHSFREREKNTSSSIKKRNWNPDQINSVSELRTTRNPRCRSIPSFLQLKAHKN